MKHAKSGENALFIEDREKLWNACEDLREKMACSIMYHGMRASTFTRMEKSWILWQSNQIQIFGTKTKNALRTIPILNGRFREVLERFFEAWPSMTKARMGSRGTLNYMLSKIAERTDITKHVHPHGLRATCALLLAESGYHAPELCAFMGWDDISSGTPYLRLAGRLATDRFNSLKKGGVNFI